MINPKADTLREVAQAVVDSYFRPTRTSSHLVSMNNLQAALSAAPPAGREEIARKVQNILAEKLGVDSHREIVGTGPASYAIADRILALTPHVRGADLREVLERLEFQFDSVARSYSGYLPDPEYFGTPDSRTRDMLIKDCTKKFRAEIATVRSAALPAPPVAGEDRVAQLEQVIRDTIESLERNSTSAPVVECLKAAVSGNERTTKETK